MRPTEVTSSGVVSVQSRQAVEHALRLLPVPDHPAGEGLLEREELELHRRDDAEVAAAAAQGEEEVALVRVVDAVELAVGRHDLDRGDRVGGHAVLAGEPADAAAERVADDADVRRGAVQGDEAVLGGGADDLLPEHAGADARLAGLGVDLDRAQLVRADEDGVGEVAERGDAVTGALGGDAQAVGLREEHGRLHVVRARRHDDQGRMLLDREVPGRALDVPALVPGGEDGAADGMTEGRDVDARAGGGESHDGSLVGVGTARLPGRVVLPQHRIPRAGPGVRRAGVPQCGYP